MKQMDIDFLSTGPAVGDIHMNNEDSKDSRRYLTAKFNEPPTESRILACLEELFPVFYFPLIQASLI